MTEQIANKIGIVGLLTMGFMALTEITIVAIKK